MATDSFQAEHKDGTVIQKLTKEQAEERGVPEGTLVATSYLEPGDEVLNDEVYQYASGPRNSEGRVSQTHEEAGTAGKKTGEAAKEEDEKKAAKKSTAKR